MITNKSEPYFLVDIDYTKLAPLIGEASAESCVNFQRNLKQDKRWVSSKAGSMTAQEKLEQAKEYVRWLDGLYTIVNT